ncbi:MAG: AarF/UbiB family protein [Novosphingobium sp.]
MIKSLKVAHRDRDRLAEILRVASRFGLGVLLQRLGLEQRGAGGDPDNDPQSLPRRSRLALEELGPTFVKLGQILATRGDLLPLEWIAELEQLHSKAPTLPFEALRPAVEAALGEAPESAFVALDPAPLAAASMAQVHRARLKDGRPVVLKIRRPGIRPRVEADLRLIAQLASVAEAASADLRRYAPAAMMRQLAEAVLEELDFTNEGRNADRIRADFAGEPKVIVPEIHWEWTSETVLVMDYIEGVPPSDGDALRAAGIDPAAIASLGADMVLDMVLINGRFHGDPHPGNLLCLPGNRLALLDLGMIGHVSPRRREEFIGFVQALNTGDPSQLAEVLGGWSAGSGVPRERVHIAAERLVQRHGGSRLVLSKLVGDFLPLMREEGLTMPPDLLLILKALVTVDGVLSGIQPEFDLSRSIRRSSLRIVQACLSPDRLSATVHALLWELARIGDDAPRLIRAAVRRLEAEPVEHRDPCPDALTLAPARLIAIAILVGAAMIALAVWLS